MVFVEVGVKHCVKLLLDNIEPLGNVVLTQEMFKILEHLAVLARIFLSAP